MSAVRPGHPQGASHARTSGRAGRGRGGLHQSVADSAKENPSVPAEGLWTLARLSQFLGIHERTVRRLVERRSIPCVRFGRAVRFLPSDVFRWLEARKEQ